MPALLLASPQSGSLMEISWLEGFIFESFSGAIIAYVPFFFTSFFNSFVGQS